MTRFERQIDRIIGLKFRTEMSKYELIKKKEKSKLYVIRTADGFHNYDCAKEVIEVNYKKFGGWE